MTTDAPAQREAGHHETQRHHAFKNGVRHAVSWLHTHAGSMVDPHAKAILNTAAFALGVDLAKDRISITPANPEPDEAVVERVKQAIYLSHYTVGDVPLSRQPKQIDRHCEKLARAALAAIPDQPKVEAIDLERAVGFLWPCYTDDKLPKLEYAARDPRCLRLAAQFATARQAGRDEAIRELREHPEKLRAKLKQHPSYSCECLDIAADYLAANRPSPEPSK